ncbi:MAG: FG-GAP repeat protein [Deltaproteobacteria bacterium]|nr:FG-GAP repeat protein [Deltaproteobacteria bacterium]
MMRLHRPPRTWTAWALATASACACGGGLNLEGDAQDAARDADATEDRADAVPDAPLDLPPEADATVEDAGVEDAALEETDPPGPCAAPEAPPRPLWPWNGAMTGSPHAPGFFAVRRPLFRWAPPAGAGIGTTYDVQLDDSCETPGFADCDFPSPEADATEVTDPSWRPGADLPVEEAPPVGRRYYWRVRSCCEGACSGWSDVRYVDVARVTRDFNGDGFSDLAVSAIFGVEPGDQDLGRVAVYDGSPAGPPLVPARILASPEGIGVHPRFGQELDFAGDLNADGFGDLVVGCSPSSSTLAPNGNAFVYFGSASGVPAYPDEILDNPFGTEDEGFGSTVAGPGDVDMDGFADLVIGAPGAGQAFVYGGAPAGIIRTAKTTIESPESDPWVNDGFGGVDPAGDVDGDGCADLVVGACRHMADPSTGRWAGRAYIYAGSRGGVMATPAAVLDPPEPDGEAFGCQGTGWGDIDGDAYGDVVVGATGGEWAPDGGRAFAFVGGPDGIVASPVASLVDPPREEGALFGIGVALVGDLDHDGFGDVIIGAWRQDNGAWDEGNAFLYPGRAEGLPATPALVLDDPGNQNAALFGRSIAAAGDVNGDGYADAVVGAIAQMNDVYAEGFSFVYLGSPAGIAAEPDIALENPFDGEVGGFGSCVL